METTKNDQFQSPWISYSVGINLNQDEGNGHVAVGSFIEGPNNEVFILSVRNLRMKYQSKFQHYYPSTKLRWIQDNLILSAGKHLTLWKHDSILNTTLLQHEFVPKANQQFRGPSLQFDFHQQKRNQMISCSLDHTFSQWDLEIQKQILQVKAHDKEINDISFTHNPSVFITVSSDGSSRQFDLREIHKSVLIYEHKNLEPLYKVTCDPHDGIYVAMTEINGEQILVYDVRMPHEPALKLKGHIDLITQISWHPIKRKTLCSSSDDGKALIWDLGINNQKFSQSFDAELEINDFCWSKNVIGLSYNQYLQLLKID